MNSSSKTIARGLLALDHVGDLRAGEGGVQVQRVRAELGAGDGGVDEAAVVAAHDRHAVALDDARVRERVRERVGAPVHVGEGQRAQLVDQRRLVRVADRGGGVAGGGRGPEAQQRRPDANQLVRADGRHDARAHERAQRVQPVRDLS